MKILAHCYTYGHNSASGADKMLQSLMEYLAARGEECKAVINDCNTPYELNGVYVQSNRSLLGEAYDWCDIVIIHLVACHEAITIARRFNKPVVRVCHNNHIPFNEGYVVYNSHWLAEEMHLSLPSIIVHPPTKPVQGGIDHYYSKYITLVNTNENKGGAMLKALATQMYRYSFLGVHGGYDKNQMYQPIKNLQYRPYAPGGMNYDDTRIIIIPSKAESWSLVAAEAMANGIPVICSDLPGLRENCGDAAVYASSVKDYIDEIVRLNDRSYYSIRSLKCRARFALHNYNEELNNFYNFIADIVNMKDKADRSIYDIVKEVADKAASQSIHVRKATKKEKREYKGLPTQKKQ